MSLLCFLLCCTMTLTKPQMIEDWIPFEVTTNELAAEEEEETSTNMHLWGVATITHYCNCSACCGQWAGGICQLKLGEFLQMDLNYECRIGEHLTPQQLGGIAFRALL